jgi:hypothetical protein
MFYRLRQKTLLSNLRCSSLWQQRCVPMRFLRAILLQSVLRRSLRLPYQRVPLLRRKRERSQPGELLVRLHSHMSEPYNLNHPISNILGLHFFNPVPVMVSLCLNPAIACHKYCIPRNWLSLYLVSKQLLRLWNGHEPLLRLVERVWLFCPAQAS